MSRKYAEVITSITHQSVDKIFNYKIPDGLRDKLEIGMRVMVPFGLGNKKIPAYVIGFSEEVDISLDKLKEIFSISDEYPVFSESTILLAKWMKNKYYTTLSSCLKCILPSGIDGQILTRNCIFTNENMQSTIDKILAKDDKQAKVLKLVIEKQGIEKNQIINKLGISSSPVNTLIKNEILIVKPFEVFRNPFLKDNFIHKEAFVLNTEQENAFEFLAKDLDNNNKKATLLHGVTGSGKTEIYLQIIDRVLAKNQQAIVLVPEISLTPQTINHFVSRFGNQVSVTHSRMTANERFDQWRRAREGNISVMIGPRSAIFTPFKDLGIIIIDEEHENTYKSETSPKYHVKEVAEKLMELTGCSVVLGSATPNVSTYYEASCGKLNLLTLKQRVNKKTPTVNIIDMREELANGNRSIFGRDLYYAIEKNLKDKKQTILFMNRRGHSTFVSCRACGTVLTCDQCSINYTYHIYNDKLMCHYCGKEEKTPKVCPTCGSKHIKYFGTGTQKIEEEIKSLFVDARVIRMDMDTTSKKHGHEKILDIFSAGKADILIGTQMIAKGHDFPNVSLVGIMAADISLNTGDFRSAETTYQLISQVSGRAGRAETEGTVFIQTYNPEHYSIVYSQENDYASFYEHEITIRKTMAYPPYSHIFMIMFVGESEKKVIMALNRLGEIMHHFNRKGLFEILGPAPAQISKINKNYRWKIFVKSEDEELIKTYVFYCLNKLSKDTDISGISINATLNPMMLY